MQATDANRSLTLFAFPCFYLFNYLILWQKVLLFHFCEWSTMSL